MSVLTTNQDQQFKIQPLQDQPNNNYLMPSFNKSIDYSSVSSWILDPTVEVEFNFDELNSILNLLNGYNTGHGSIKQKIWFKSNKKSINS